MSGKADRVAAAWLDVRSWLAESESGRLLAAHLAARYSRDGRLTSVLADEPVMDLPLWLAGPVRVTESDAHRVTASLLSGFGAVEARSLVGALSRHEVDRLAERLWHRAADHMGHALWGGTGFGSLEVDADPIAVLLEMAAAAGATLGGRQRDTALRLAERLATGLTLERDVRELVPSLRAGRMNEAARRLVDGVGLAPDEASFHRLLGMVALGEGRQAILGPWSEALDQAASAASEFDSPELEAWIDLLRGRLNTVASPGGSLVVGAARLRPLTLFGRSEVPGSGPIDLAMGMARGFLLADPELQESWEVHRRGFLGHHLVSAPFPAGLVLEVLARHGEDVGAQTVSYLGRLADQDFSYYDVPEFPWVETDTIGTVLRLIEHVQESWPWLARIQRHVSRALVLIESSGDVPVWLADDPGKAPGMLLLGEECGAIQARFLTVLLAQDRESVPGQVIDRFLQRFAERGVSIGVNYPPLYTAAAVREVIGEAVGFADEERLMGARVALRKSLEEWRPRTGTPLQAALFVIACAGSDDADLISGDLVETIVDSQDPDGGWPGEPLFFVPNRGGAVTWHRSRQLTAAFCFDALIRWAGRP